MKVVSFEVEIQAEVELSDHNKVPLAVLAQSRTVVPGQTCDWPVILMDGLWKIVIECEALAVQPFASVIVAVYDPVLFTLIHCDEERFDQTIDAKEPTTHN